MNKPTSKNPLTIKVPMFAVLAFCAAAAFVGRESAPKATQPAEGADIPKYAVAERTAIILQSVLSHPGESKDQLQERISDPIVSVLKKYTDAGYIVIDAARDENGNYVIAALPESTKDITKEMASAIDQAEQQAKLKDAGNGK